MSSEPISPSNLPPLSASARFSAASSSASGSSPSAISFGRSVISPTPTMTGMRCSETRAVVLGIFLVSLSGQPIRRGRCILRHCERSEAIHLSAKQVWIASSRSLSSGAHSRDPLAPRNDGEGLQLLRHQRVHVLHRLDEIFLEFLHHGARGFHAV